MLTFIVSHLRKKQIESFLELDKKVYKNNFQVSKETTEYRLTINPFTDIVVSHQSNIVGYISLLPINNSTYKQILEQSMTEEEIEKSIIRYDSCGNYAAYLSSIVVDKEKFPYYKGMYLFELLQKFMQKLKKRGVFIKKIIATAATKAGEKTLRKLGFIQQNDNIFTVSSKAFDIQWFMEKVLYNIFCILNSFVFMKYRWGSV